MKFKLYLLLTVILVLLSQSVVSAETTLTLNPLEKKGKYLVTLAGCNDCHTSGYARRSGRIKVENWLTGNNIGFKGPWGVTYGTNLRLYFSRLTEEQWLQRAKNLKTRPPMPWFVIRSMRDDDLRSIYAFIKRLGKKGQPAPTSTARGQAPKTSFINFMPQSAPEEEDPDVDE